MKKFYYICKGWFLFLFAKRSEMAKRRLEKCWPCDKRKTYFCSMCWCELHAKAEIEEEECEYPTGSKWEIQK